MPAMYPFLKEPTEPVHQFVTGCSDGLDYFFNHKHEIIGAQPTDISNKKLVKEIFKKSAAELTAMYDAIPEPSITPKP